RGFRFSLTSAPGYKSPRGRITRPNCPQWRAGTACRRFRIFYDIDQDNEVVKIEAVGYKQQQALRAWSGVPPMKTVTIAPQAADINVLLEQARQEDILVRAADGTEFMLTAVEDFDEEIA